MTKKIFKNFLYYLCWGLIQTTLISNIMFSQSTTNLKETYEAGKNAYNKGDFETAKNKFWWIHMIHTYDDYKTNHQCEVS